MQTTVEAVFAVMKNNAEKAKELLLHVIPKIAAKDWTEIVKGYQVHTPITLAKEHAINELLLVVFMQNLIFFILYFFTFLGRSKEVYILRDF